MNSKKHNKDWLNKRKRFFERIMKQYEENLLTPQKLFSENKNTIIFSKFKDFLDFIPELFLLLNNIHLDINSLKGFGVRILYLENVMSDGWYSYSFLTYLP